MDPDENMEKLDRRRYHEAGHAVMMHRYGFEIDHVCTFCDDGTGEAVPLNEDAVRAHPRIACLIAVAGEAATMLVANRRGMSQDDLDSATTAIRKILCDNREFDHIEDIEQHGDALSLAESPYLAGALCEAAAILNQSKYERRLKFVAERLKSGPINDNAELVMVIANADR